MMPAADTSAQIAIEQYLASLRKGMFGVAGRRKRDVCDEIGADLEARIARSQGNLQSVFSNAADPVALGKAMRAVHGISWWLRLLFWIPAPLLGIFSFPMISAFFPAVPTTLFLALGTLLTVSAGAVGGRFAGLVTGLLVAVPRIIWLLVTTVLIEFVQESIGYSSWSIDGGTAFVILLTSILLPIIGFLVGKRVSA